MTMLTRCPHCDTVFRVTPQQLQKQHGQVRCGRCTQVFDGFRTLSSESSRNVAEPAGGRIADVAPPPAAAPPRPQPSEPVVAAAPPAPAPGAPPAPAASATHVPSEDPFATTPDDEALDVQPAHRGRTYAWAFASVLAAVVLVGQAAYVYRVELAANYPGLKPVLARACDALHCTVPLPQQPRLISIEASDLQVPDAARPGVIQLTATLRSHAQYDVAYPALDLVLTNAQEHTLARRIFAPREYLSPSRDPGLGIPPNAEVTLQLDLDTGDLGASGFRLDLLRAAS
jgi:predicted Zn finger-like uncharacterized protein